MPVAGAKSIRVVAEPRLCKGGFSGVPLTPHGKHKLAPLFCVTSRALGDCPHFFRTPSYTYLEFTGPILPSDGGTNPQAFRLTRRRADSYSLTRSHHASIPSQHRSVATVRCRL